jgi:hypothetical protein
MIKDPRGGGRGGAILKEGGGGGGKLWGQKGKKIKVWFGGIYFFVFIEGKKTYV